MAEAAVAFLLPKLYDVIQRRVVSFLDTPEEARKLHETLKFLQAFLQDADEKRKESKTIETWVSQVRDAAFEAEDIIDEFILKVDKKHLRDRDFIGFLTLHCRRFQTGGKIQRINERLEKIAANRSKYGIVASGGPSTSSTKTERRAPIVEEVDVVGIQDQAKMVAKLLIGEEDRRCVVSIVGMGGLGKTTLAKKVYDHLDVKNHFECFAWVYVSQECRDRDLFMDCIKCLKSINEDEYKRMKSMSALDLGNMLKSYLEGKRYLVVIDDIWRIEDWNSLQAFFPKEMNGSRIMLTTRNRTVAKEADPGCEPHMLRYLTEEEGWELLSKKAFPKGLGHDCPNHLEEVGRKIVGKCKGLPLAVVVLGGLLSTRDQSIYEWEKVLKSISWQWTERENAISRILHLSYSDLPYYLKSCFLHFGVYPEDSIIPVTELVRIWVAEGFIEERGDETMEEVAEDCLWELTQRSMIQVAQRSINGRIKKCRIHDLLRDLAIKEAKEDAFLHVYGNVDSALPTTARRLSINHHGIGKYIHLNRSSKHLRSLYCFTEYSEWLEKAELKPIHETFKFLRVMHLDGANIKTLPGGIGDLVHLRYLLVRFMRGILMDKLPSSLSRLCNLQTLSIRGHDTYDFLYIPDVSNMKQLRHVRLDNGVFPRQGKNLQLDKLTNLQTLSSMWVGDWVKDDLGKLTTLRDLGLRGDLRSMETALSYSVGKLKNLRLLWLMEPDVKGLIPMSIPWSNLQYLETLYLYGRLGKLADPEGFPRLTKLILKLAKLEQDPMTVLEKVPNLKYLKFIEESYLGEKISCSANGFPKLGVLHIEHFINLKEWTIEAGAMPNIRYLEIYHCYKLKMVPEGLRDLTTLQELVFAGQPGFFLDRVGKTGEDYCKIQHVPTITIR